MGEPSRIGETPVGEGAYPSHGEGDGDSLIGMVPGKPSKAGVSLLTTLILALDKAGTMDLPSKWTGTIFLLCPV